MTHILSFFTGVYDCFNHTDYHRIIHLLVLLPFCSSFHPLLGAYMVTIVFLGDSIFCLAISSQKLNPIRPVFSVRRRSWSQWVARVSNVGTSEP